MNYELACKEAADRQGVTAVVEALDGIGIWAVAEQTGGFCMVATVNRADGRFLGITDVGPEEGTEEGRPSYLVVEYFDSDDWSDCEELASGVGSLDDLKSIVSAWVNVAGDGFLFSPAVSKEALDARTD